LRREREEEVERSEIDFKNLVFANNPELYMELFEKLQIEEEEVEWAVPQDEGDVMYMMEQLKKAGIFKS
jgi:hypothetical protein